MSNKKSVSLKEIALSLSLSINTVSRALRDCDDISDETKRRVRQKADELGYYLPKAKERYSSPHPKTVILFLNDLKSTYFLKLSGALVDRYQEKGYQCYLLPSRKQALDIDVVKECILRQTDLLVSFIDVEDSAALYAKELGLRLLLLGRESKSDFLSDIYADDYRGGEIASQYLSEKGAKKRIYIGLAPLEVSYRRLNGFMADGQKNALETLYYDWKDLKDAALETIKQHIHGVFTFNDECAVQFIDELKKLDYPLSDIHIVGFDNTIHYLGYATYHFASVSADYEELLDKTMSLSLRALEDTSYVPCKEKISVSLDSEFDF